MTKKNPTTITLTLLLIAATLMLVVSFVDGASRLVSPPIFKNTSTSSFLSIPTQVSLELDNQSFSTPSASLTTPKSLELFSPTKHGIQAFTSLLFPSNTPLPKNPLDNAKIRAWITQVAAIVSISPQHPRVEHKKNATPPYSVLVGKLGQEVDIEATTEIIEQLDLNASNSAALITKTTGTQLSGEEIHLAEQRAAQFVTAKIILQAKNYSRILTQTEVLSLLSLPKGYSEDGIHALLESVTQTIGSPPIEPKLVLEDTIVKEFIAPRDGVGVDSEENKKLLLAQLEKIDAGEKPETITLALTTQSPQTSLAETNSLGIKERLGFGESNYSHSIANRIHNVSHTTSKIHSKLIMPGETFSFNKYLGDVSAQTGFKQAYVIKEGQTVLGDGGGVCQVSSTLFRAILNAGLPITERRGHSYRVSYYEQNSKPGFDATVYAPHPDLRFVNDTLHPILINAIADSKKTYMYVELYGTLDGRKAEITNYKQSGARPAPPAHYQDDPSLKPGQIRQIEFASPGLNTSFDYIVTYPSGEKKEQTFKTSYVPWRAVYLRGP